MGADVKLRKLKTTIIFSLTLLCCSPAVLSLERKSNVRVDQDTYTIEVKIEATNRTRDNRIAPLLAKSALVRYFKQKKQIISVDLKHFSPINSQQNQQEKVFLFKVKKSDITINKK